MVKRLNNIDYVVNGANVAKANELLTRFEERDYDVTKIVLIYNLTFRENIKYEIILNELRSVLNQDLKEKWFSDYYMRDWLDLWEVSSKFSGFLKQKEFFLAIVLHLVLIGEVNLYISPNDALVDCSLIKLNNLDPVHYMYDLALEISNLTPDFELSFEEENEMLADEADEDYILPEIDTNSLEWEVLKKLGFVI